MGHRWGLVGINCDLHMNPRGGAFDLSLHNLCHEVRMAAKKVLKSQKEAECSLEEGKNYFPSEGRK